LSVISSWSALPVAIRIGIVAMVTASAGPVEYGVNCP
jgi:hypothetical protein